jgi:hypothetical protein
MSTYYDFVCDVHKERVDAVCVCRNCPDRWSGLYEDELPRIRKFLIAHADCNPRLVSEYDDAQYEYEVFDKRKTPTPEAP